MIIYFWLTCGLHLSFRSSADAFSHVQSNNKNMFSSVASRCATSAVRPSSPTSIATTLFDRLSMFEEDDFEEDEDDEEDYEEDYEGEYDEDLEDDYEFEDREKEKTEYEDLFLDEEHEWDSHAGVDILLPSPSVKPKAIIHFIGGTFLGSLPPRLVYSAFLEGLARECKHDIAIIATPIPFLQTGKIRLISPLDHGKKVKSIRQMLRDVYDNVLCEEYSPQSLKRIPTIGVGHSLGGRLHVLLNSRKVFPKEGNPTSSNRVKGNVMVSFNNFNAERSVPFLNGVKKAIQRNEGRRRGYEERDEYDEMYSRSRRREKNSMFEFNPTPAMVWDIVGNRTNHEYDETRVRRCYTVAKNLLVQFDKDELDQSSELAQKLVSDDNHGLKFAILKGNHLTPCIGLNDILQDAEESKYGNMEDGGRASKRKKELSDLISSVATYIDTIIDEENEL